MKQRELLALIRRFAPAGLVTLLGLLLLLSPDTASGLLGRIFGWCLIIGGGLMLLDVLVTRGVQAGKLIASLLGVSVGLWLLREPLALALWLGRLVGILLTVRGLQEMSRSASGQGKLLSLALTVLGIVLILLPMTTTRAVFRLLGAVVLAVGVLMILSRIREQKLLPPKDDGGPDIIDAL